MGALTFKPPPSPNSGRQDGGWVELVSGLLLDESSHILRELDIEGINTRTTLDASGVTILVRLHSLEDARFVLARVAFSRSATLDAPPAETGRRRSSTAPGVVGLVAGLLVLLSALAMAPADEGPDLRCPGARGSLMAPRGGCLGIAPTEHRLTGDDH